MERRVMRLFLATLGFLGAGFGAGLLASPGSAPQEPTTLATSETEPEVPHIPKPAPRARRAPSLNYALATAGAAASGGNRAELLIDGNSTQYDGGNGYAETAWNAQPPQALLITLKEAQTVNLVRFKLWDQDGRFYRYKVEICPDLDNARWKTIEDRSHEKFQCRSWQNIVFPTQDLRRVRVTGTFNSVNGSFHAVELEAYDAPDGLDGATFDSSEF